MSNNNNLILKGNDNENLNVVNNYIKNNKFSKNLTPQNKMNYNGSFNLERNSQRGKNGPKIPHNGLSIVFENHDINNNQSYNIMKSKNYSQMPQNFTNNSYKSTEELLEENCIGRNNTESTQKESLESNNTGNNISENHNENVADFTEIQLIYNNIIDKNTNNNHGNNSICQSNNDLNNNINNNIVEQERDEKNCLEKINKDDKYTEIKLEKEYYIKKDNSNFTELKLQNEFFNNNNNINNSKLNKFRQNPLNNSRLINENKDDSNKNQGPLKIYSTPSKNMVNEKNKKEIIKINLININKKKNINSRYDNNNEQNNIMKESSLFNLVNDNLKQNNFHRSASKVEIDTILSINLMIKNNFSRRKTKDEINVRSSYDGHKKYLNNIIDKKNKKK